MARSSRRKRRRPIRQPDRLSDLPEGILHHILSLLPFDEAVRTSVLSSLWRGLWRTNPCLRFPSFAYLTEDHIYSNQSVEAVDSCLDQCSSIDHFTELSFTIDKHVCKRDEAARRWAKFASCRLVDCLSFTYCYPDLDEADTYFEDVDELDWFLPVPDALFCCWTLVTLKLDHCRISFIPSEFGRTIFPFLENLFLVSIFFISEKSLSELVSASPKLKNLNIAGVLKWSDKLVISSPTLEILDVYKCVLKIPCPVEIKHTPNLHSLGLVCDITNTQVENLTNLEETTLLTNPRRKLDYNQWKLLISSIRGTKYLAVDDWFGQFKLSSSFDFRNCPSFFANLKRLDICGEPEGVDWLIGLMCNLSFAPLLEEIVFDLECPWSRRDTSNDDTDNDSDPDSDSDSDTEINSDINENNILENLHKSVPKLPPIKIITIHCYFGEVAVTSLIEFILTKGTCLESVVIYQCSEHLHYEGTHEGLERMRTCEKASPFVEISSKCFYYHGNRRKMRHCVRWNPKFED